LAGPEEIKFKCRRCGACCRAMKCPFLIGYNHCVVFEFRPIVCRVNLVAESMTGLDKLAFFKAQRKHCARLRKEEMDAIQEDIGG